MPTFHLSIEIDNAAFQDNNAPHEIARILREAADKIADGQTLGKLRDINGNTVGAFNYDQDTSFERT